MPQSAAGQDACDLTDQKCVPCEGGVFPLGPDEAKSRLAELGDGWHLDPDHHLEREWRFRDFRSALAFTNRVGELADAEGHHPDLLLGWGRVKVTLYTHAIDGLSQNDFILAARISALNGGAP